MKLYEVQATEYNGEQEYSQSKLLAARNIKHARQIARDYFRQWYDDDDEPQDHNTDNPDEFEFICGCIRLKIKSVREITPDEWIKTQITLHSIPELPDELMTTGIARSAVELLEACKVLTSYTMDLLYRLDNQVNIADVEEVQQAKAAIAQYAPADISVQSQQGKMILKEQSADCPQVTIPIQLVCENGQLWIQPKGYGEKCAEDGEGFPIGIEIWQGKLRLIAFNDINSEDPQIISLENAKESCRIEDSQEGNCPSYCAAAEYLAAEGQKIFTGHMNGGLWNARCMDACILSKKQNDKAAYELLIKYGDQYAQAISDEQKDVWQKIKEAQQPC